LICDANDSSGFDDVTNEGDYMKISAGTICALLCFLTCRIQAQELPDLGQATLVQPVNGRLIAMATAPQSGLVGALQSDSENNISCRVWSEQGRELWHSKIPGNRVYSLAFGREGEILAVGGVGAASWMMQRRSSVTNRGTVRIFDAKTGKMWRSFPVRRNGYIHSIAVAPHGSTLAVAGHSWIDVWDYSTQRQLGSLAMDGEVTSLHFSPNGQLLASASLWSPPTVWNIQKRKIAFTLPRQEGQTFGIAFSPSGTTLVLAGFSFLSSYDLKGRQRWKIAQNVGFAPSYDRPTSSLSFSPDGKWLTVTGTTSLLANSDGKQRFALPRVEALRFGQKSLWGSNRRKALRWLMAQTRCGIPT
jgi:WD40 repeat protein